ncbi:unnamed protein product [Nyctereutes procyonoides]|uniref:Ribosome production factor 1 n=1 Tax=Nyctereutes procyonoides TaxID=34880 RepID=A0A811ZT56_NYCPR|nr:unnamed protein product [Nyctereutes procyonoides]
MAWRRPGLRAAAGERGAQPLKSAAFPPGSSISEIQNKQQTLNEKVAIKKQLKKKKLLATGNQRVYDETMVDPNAETLHSSPHVYYPRGLALKKITPQRISRDFTDLIVINEDCKTPNGLILSHLPSGPTAHLAQTARLHKEIKRRGKDPTEPMPEIILNDLMTRLGHSIGRMFASLFPQNPQCIGRQVATFHNQRDYIFFRFHRCIFKSEKKVRIQELGPCFTLRLRSLQKGTFDSKYGEYE